MFEQKCGECHSLNKPFSKSETQLKEIVPAMAKKAKIDAATQDLIYKYLVTMTKKQG